MLEGRKLTSGGVRGLTLIVEFDDVRTNITSAAVEAMLNDDNYSANGNFCSVKKYFELVSSGKLTYTNTVVGPIRLSKRRSHYINNLLVEEALDKAVADFGVDLSDFDSRNENIVDAINFLYAGESQFSGDLWPHNSVKQLRYGDTRTHFYLLTGLGVSNVDLRIGTIAHENGHLLCRFPDMYDYGERDGDSEQSRGIGSYCLMGSGNYLNARRTPAPVCAYLRDLAGWTSHAVDLNAPGSHTAKHGDYSTVMKFRTDKPNEYFIVENRSRLGLDAHLPASGLAVYHCDTLGSNEWQRGTLNRHYQCALLQADGHLDLENNRNGGDGGDLFADSAAVALSHETVPSSREWDGTDSGLVISEVSQPGQAMTFAIGLPQNQPKLRGETFPNAVIPDKDPRGVSAAIPIHAIGTARSIDVSVQIIHSWISDLVVTLESPSGKVVTLHDRKGGDGDDIHRSWSDADFPGLQDLRGEEIEGDWRLQVVDHASADVGRLVKWSLDLGYEQGDRVIEEAADRVVEIPDRNPAGVKSTIALSATSQVKDLVVYVDIDHSWIGDLQVDLIAPSGQSSRLHANEGRDQDAIKRAYDRTSTPTLDAMVGQEIQGDWNLRVRDLAHADVGRLNRWTLRIQH